jgi:hypothetical protein
LSATVHTVLKDDIKTHTQSEKLVSITGVLLQGSVKQEDVPLERKNIYYPSHFPRKFQGEENVCVVSTPTKLNCSLSLFLRTI